MKIKDVLQSTRVAYFENDGTEGFDYSSGGTGFLCKFKNSYFFVTANHVVARRNPDDLRVATRAGPDPTEFLSFDRRGVPEPDQEGIRDFVVLHIHSGDGPQAWRQCAMPLTEDFVRTGRNSLRKDGKLIISGYPGDLREIDFEDLVLREQRAIIGAVYDKPLAETQWLHAARIIDPPPTLIEMAGMSGSPVFGHASRSEIGLAGILIWGGPVTAPVHFIDSAVLWNALTGNEGTLGGLV